MTDAKKCADEILDQLAAFGQARYGDAIKEYWFYREDLARPARSGHPALSGTKVTTQSR